MNAHMCGHHQSCVACGQWSHMNHWVRYSNRMSKNLFESQSNSDRFNGITRIGRKGKEYDNREYKQIYKWIKSFGACSLSYSCHFYFSWDIMCKRARTFECFGFRLIATKLIELDRPSHWHCIVSQMLCVVFILDVSVRGTSQFTYV